MTDFQCLKNPFTDYVRSCRFCRFLNQRNTEASLGSNKQVEATNHEKNLWVNCFVNDQSRYLTVDKGGAVGGGVGVGGGAGNASDDSDGPRGGDEVAGSGDGTARYAPCLIS